MKPVTLDPGTFAGLRHIHPPRASRSESFLGIDDATCIRCPDEPCVQFTPQEVERANSTQVCPVGAITEASAPTGPIIDDSCFGCGICVVRCPVGALKLNLNAIPPVQVQRPDSESSRPAVDADDFAVGRNESSKGAHWDRSVWEGWADRLKVNTRFQSQGTFYPLVAILFTLAGIPARLAAAGDTSNRIDLVLIHHQSSLPVEIKSPTESDIINVKSVQQALENRVVLDQRAFFPAGRNDSSLVVGFAYPPDRSGVTELVDDIFKAFGIRIGLVSLADLYLIALKSILADSRFMRTDLVTLKGTLR